MFSSCKLQPKPLQSHTVLPEKRWRTWDASKPLTGSVEWAKAKSPIHLHGMSYVDGLGRLVTWGSKDRIDAQTELKRRLYRDYLANH
jgi:uncharacterized membrane protein